MTSAVLCRPAPALLPLVGADTRVPVVPSGSVRYVDLDSAASSRPLVAVAERVTGRSITTRIGAHPGRGWDTTDWVCDPSAAREELHWTPQVDLAEGLARCWAAR